MHRFLYGHLLTDNPAEIPSHNPTFYSYQVFGHPETKPSVHRRWLIFHNFLLHNISNTRGSVFYNRCIWTTKKFVYRLKESI